MGSAQIQPYHREAPLKTSLTDVPMLRPQRPRSPTPGAAFPSCPREAGGGPIRPGVHQELGLRSQVVRGRPGVLMLGPQRSRSPGAGASFPGCPREAGGDPIRPGVGGLPTCCLVERRRRIASPAGPGPSQWSTIQPPRDAKVTSAAQLHRNHAGRALRTTTAVTAAKPASSLFTGRVSFLNQDGPAGLPCRCSSGGLGSHIPAGQPVSTPSSTGHATGSVRGHHRCPG